MFSRSRFLSWLIVLQVACLVVEAKNPGIDHNRTTSSITITVPDKKLSLVVDYATGCTVNELRINSENTLSKAGVFTGVRIGNKQFTSPKRSVVR